MMSLRAMTLPVVLVIVSGILLPASSISISPPEWKIRKTYNSLQSEQSTASLSSSFTPTKVFHPDCKDKGGRKAKEGRKSQKMDCRKEYLELFQGSQGTEPNGIPKFRVQIINQCPTQCSISAIHLSCGQFSSAVLVNPNIFKRLRIGDCLVNGGGPLAAGHVLSFTYADSFMHPLSISSFSCTSH